MGGGGDVLARETLTPGDLLTVPQVLSILPIGKSTLYALIADGQIVCHRVSAAGGGRGRVLIARRDLEAFVARTRETRPRAPTRVDVDGLLKKVRGQCG
jgi:excisionase family DNA binding protein